MRYRAYKKSIKREILSSKARFASILVIILLGVAFFSGIKSSGPDMNKAVNELYKNQNLMDSKIVSTLGLSDKDIELLKNNDKILDFYPTHTIDANLENLNVTACIECGSCSYVCPAGRPLTAAMRTGKFELRRLQNAK